MSNNLKSLYDRLHKVSEKVVVLSEKAVKGAKNSQILKKISSESERREKMLKTEIDGIEKELSSTMKQIQNNYVKSRQNIARNHRRFRKLEINKKRKR